MTDQVLSLKWNNHQMSFTNKISCLYSKEQFSDVTIACDENFYPAHKFVLSTCSEYFEKMFKLIDSKNPIIVLKDFTQKNVEMLLSYMYLGEVNVDQAELPSLMKAAESLRIKGLAVTDTEEKPKKRKLPFEGESSKRRNIETNPINKKPLSSIKNEKVSSQSAVESRSIKNVRDAVLSPPVDNKPPQEILYLPVKEEKVETTEQEYFDDSPNFNSGPSTSDNYTEENYMQNEPLQETEFQDYPEDSYDTAQSTETDQDYMQGSLTKKQRLHYGHLFRHQTTMKTEMTKQLIVHTGERQYCCRYCPYKTRENFSLNRHVAIRHLLPGNSVEIRPHRPKM